MFDPANISGHTTRNDAGAGQECRIDFGGSLAGRRHRLPRRRPQIYSLQDVIIKLVSGSYPISEVLFFRAVTALPLLW